MSISDAIRVDVLESRQTGWGWCCLHGRVSSWRCEEGWERVEQVVPALVAPETRGGSNTARSESAPKGSTAAGSKRVTEMN